jgi:hypothetical protein
MLPVRYPRQQNLVEVAKDAIERLALLGRLRGQRRPDLARGDLRQNRQ